MNCNVYMNIGVADNHIEGNSSICNHISNYHEMCKPQQSNRNENMSIRCNSKNNYMLVVVMVIVVVVVASILMSAAIHKITNQNNFDSLLTKMDLRWKPAHV